MMQKRLSAVVVTLGFSVLPVVISGCATNRTDPVDKGIVSVETVPSRKVNILRTDVYKDSEGFVVYGVVQRLSDTSYPIKTHVDITILSRDGTVLQEARTSDIYVPRRIPGKGISWERFQIRFPHIPPQGSKVNMIVHGGRHNGQT
jgi:hypothetical protein